MQGAQQGFKWRPAGGGMSLILKRMDDLNTHSFIWLHWIIISYHILVHGFPLSIIDRKGSRSAMMLNLWTDSLWNSPVSYIKHTRTVNPEGWLLSSQLPTVELTAVLLPSTLVYLPGSSRASQASTKAGLYPLHVSVGGTKRGVWAGQKKKKKEIHPRSLFEGQLSFDGRRLCTANVWSDANLTQGCNNG